MDTQRFLRENLEVNTGQTFVANEEEYILQGKVGDGAIGVVRKAENKRTGKIVAVKFLAPELRYIEVSSLDDIHSRFRREGLRGVSLEHDSLVKVIAYEDNENGLSFPSGNGPHNPLIVMEYVRGRTLENHIRKYRREEPSFNITKTSLSIALGIVNALVYLHEKKLVHRDVKPANIYLSSISDGQIPSTVKLGDFGVVKWGDFRASMTTGLLTVSGAKGLGTWKYMSPEQATKPKDVNVRSDMYSLGIALFELFTNQILATPHHVFQLTQQRMQRSSNAMSRLYDLGLGMVPQRHEHLFELIYDMFLTSPKGRPSSINTYHMLKNALEKESYM